MLESWGRCPRPWSSVGVLCLALGVSACASDAADAPSRGIPKECTVLEPGEVATLDAQVHVLASDDALGEPAGSLTRSLLPDGGDVYWYDAHAGVFVERQGDGRVVQLKERGEREGDYHEAGLGLAANGDRLFVGFALMPNVASDTFQRLEYEPPGSLVSISKQGGQAEVLLTLPDHWVAPIAADAERVIVFARGHDESGVGEVGFYQVPLAAPRLEPLPRSTGGTEYGGRQALTAPLLWGQLVGEEMYWVGSDYEPPRLLRAGFLDAQPEQVMSLPANPFYSVGPGYILTQQEAVLPGYYSAGMDFVLRDDAGCRAVRGPRGKAVLGTALDESTAYWAGGTPRSYGAPWTAVDDIQLTRIDLASGALTRINTPGFTPSVSLSIPGHDDTRVFLYSAGTLVSVRKPEPVPRP